MNYGYDPYYDVNDAHYTHPPTEEVPKTDHLYPQYANNAQTGQEFEYDASYYQNYDLNYYAYQGYAYEQDHAYSYMENQTYEAQQQAYSYDNTLPAPSPYNHI
jgi:hypothetical protein